MYSDDFGRKIGGVYPTVFRSKERTVSMSHPVPVGPEGIRETKDMSAEELLAHHAELAKRIVGPMPQAPVYPSASSGGGVKVGPAGEWGTAPIVDRPIIPADFPNAAQMSADYLAALNAWNERFRLVFAELRKGIS